MRLIAIILNAVWIHAVIYFVYQGRPDRAVKGEEIAIIALVLLVPIVSLAALCFDNSVGWISLYFKRKTMEEKAKISRLAEPSPHVNR